MVGLGGRSRFAGLFITLLLLPNRSVRSRSTLVQRSVQQQLPLVGFWPMLSVGSGSVVVYISGYL